MSDIETINIGELDASISLETPSNYQPSVNFGTGVELLMNDKKKKGSGANTPTSDINLGDLQDLEHELNELTDNQPENKQPSMRDARSSLFSSAPTQMNVSFNDRTDNDNLSITSIKTDTDLNINREPTPPMFKLNKDSSNDKTWDGYGKIQ